MDAPQIVMIVLFAAMLVVNLIEHGKIREHPYDKYNFWIVLLRVVIFSSILYWGGFWS